MINTAELYDSRNHTPFLDTARILTIDNKKRTAKIYLDSLSGVQNLYAVLALSFEVELAHGDRVLVTGDNLDTIYIIGVLSVKSATKIRSKDGAYAQLVDANGRSFLQIFSKQNNLIVEYDTKNNKIRVDSENGALEISAAESLILKGETISLEGKKQINASVQDLSGDVQSFLSLGKHQMKLSSSDLRMTAGRGHLFFKELNLSGKKLISNLVQATIIVDKLETTAQSIINKTKNIFQTVENLSQLKTGRLKTLVKSTYHLKSRKSILKSENDFKIKAEKIDLG